MDLKHISSGEAQNALPEELIDDISSILSSESPNIARLYNKLEKHSSISPADIRALIYQFVAKINAELFPPITNLELILTERCNLACAYCFEEGMVKCRKMPRDIAQASVDLLFDYSRDEQALSITHFGGEPTLNFPVIRHATEYAEQKAALLGKSIDFNMTSNGTLLTDEMVDYFARHKINVLLSIDGLEATHNRYRVDRRGNGSFDKAIRGLEILKRGQSWIGVKMTVMPENVSSMFEDVVGLYQRGVNQFLIGHATGAAWSEEDIASYSGQLHRLYRWYIETDRDNLRISVFDDSGLGSSIFGCQAGRNSISVSANGEISSCSKVLGLNNRQLIAKLGDIRHGLIHLRNRFEIVSCTRLYEACKEQGIADGFRGGCFAANYVENQDIFEPSIQEHAFSMIVPTIHSSVKK